MKFRNSENKGKKKKIDEKILEEQMSNLISQQSNQGNVVSSNIATFLLFKAAKRLERYSIFLLILSIALAGSILFLALVLAYTLGLIP